MGNDDSASILTDAQREWLKGEKQVSHEKQMRKRIYKRIRAVITTDAKLVADALEEGELDPKTVVKDIDFAEVGNGVSDLVTALYLLCDAVKTDMDGNAVSMDAEKTIQNGVLRGKKGRIAALEKKLDEQGIESLTVGELIDLRNEKPEHAQRLNYQLNRAMSDVDTEQTGMRDTGEASETSNSDE